MKGTLYFASDRTLLSKTTATYTISTIFADSCGYLKETPSFTMGGPTAEEWQYLPGHSSNPYFKERFKFL